MKKIFKLFFLCLLFLTHSVYADELYLEPVIQGVISDEWVTIFENKGDYFVEVDQLARALKIKLKQTGNLISGELAGEKFNIQVSQLPRDKYVFQNKRRYIALSVFEKALRIGLKVNRRSMQLFVTAQRDLPLKTEYSLQKRQKQFIRQQLPDTFFNYDFDNRWWSWPVADLTIQKGFNINDYHGDRERNDTQTGYQLDLSMLALGLDTSLSVFGNNSINDYRPRIRLTAGRTFLEEPKNPFHLTTFEVGDITGFNSTLFNNNAAGRGAYASSFKDLVLSADKTIDINGPLSEGWQVELYQNDQLIGFRQNSKNGRYQFPNIPVSYGLNVFKLIFYGPFGEIRTEEERYYSGTSPVKSGEFGYIFNGYQADRYLFEHNEPNKVQSDQMTLDFVGYYGITDHVNVNVGMSRSVDADTNNHRDFSTIGAQIVAEGVSFQYNTMYGLKNKKVGHHVDVQGDIYIGDLFARYDYYGHLYSPVSYYNGSYLKELGEARLTGNISKLSVPYYVSYLYGKGIDSKNDIRELRTRLSPNFWQHYNVSLENVWTKNRYREQDALVLLLQAQYDKLGFHTRINYQVHPTSYLSSWSQQVDYRWDQYTYAQFDWNHDCRSHYSDESDLDRFSISAGKIFSFGGLTLSLNADTDKNASFMLTYNVGLGKIPNEMRPVINGRNKLTERSAIYTRVKDENGQPIPKARLLVSGQQKPVVCDENGGALVSDLEPYAKTWITIDTTSINDLSLVTPEIRKKLVLRPGTILETDFVFTHQGGFEGWIQSEKNRGNYVLSLHDKTGKKIEEKYPESDGSFIFDGIPFGEYDLKIFDEKGSLIKKQAVKLDESFKTLSDPIRLTYLAGIMDKSKLKSNNSIIGVDKMN